ncbi:hypothetical protein SASPL_118809 [Salvia splendens]|uniref:Uncharacterized protein n=1 Tax=Salvia splendens TaxID=180675 RepID=A0A8X8Y0D0_SALSN|nr:hypothetical protein SASPL_118809 [Salvia splendens]
MVAGILLSGGILVTTPESSVSAAEVAAENEIGYERLLANPTKLEAISKETDATDAIIVARRGFVENGEHKQAIVFMFVDEADKRPASMECVSNPTL